METVGVYLKKERESRNISLHEVSRLTKISELYLDYIEKDEFEKLPQGPYAKGYIASYSRLIGGNVDEALQLYESLNCRCPSSDAIQTEISNPDGGCNLPKTSDAKAAMTFDPATDGSTISSSSTVSSYLRVAWASLKSALPSPKSILVHLKKIPSPLHAFKSTPKAKPPSSAATAASTETRGRALPIATLSVQPIILFLKKIASALRTRRWLSDRRMWLYGCVTVFGAGILILAGFGFYHLFIYDPAPESTAEVQKSENKENTETASLPAMGDQKTVSVSTSDNAPVSTVLDTATPRQPLNPETPAGTSFPAAPAGTPLSGSLNTGDNQASPAPAAETETRGSSDPQPVSDGPSPAPAAVNADLSVLQASVCSGIKNRMPTGVDTIFPASVPRVYVWSAIEARRVPSKIRHIYYFEGKKISDVTLEVKSPYWRTWSFKYMETERYRGEWQVDIATAGGKVLRRLFFEVR